MTRARTPRPHEVDDARRDPRLVRALREGARDPAWRVRGVCQTVDPEVFFPAPSEPADRAVALCRSCPVQGSCLAWALDAGDLHGVWGGTTARERRAMSVVWRGWQHGAPPAAASPLLGAGTPAVAAAEAGAGGAGIGAAVADAAAGGAIDGGAVAGGAIDGGAVTGGAIAGGTVVDGAGGAAAGAIAPVPGPAGTGDQRGRQVPSPCGSELTELGPVMDRAELLRLVRAG